MPKQQDYVVKLTPLEGAKIYAQLSKDVRSAGIMERDYLFYFILSAIVYTGFFTCLYFLITTNRIIPLILLTIPFSFFSVQIAGLMHDAGHFAIFNLVKNNDIVGRIAGAVSASMYSFWKIRHNEHHAHPNDVDDDEDVLDFPFFSFSEERVRKSKGIFKKIMKYQPYVYYPLQIIFGIGMRVSFGATYLQKKKKASGLEVTTYLIGLFVWLVLPFIVFGPVKGLILTVLPTMFTGLYLANIFAPNHKGMPLIKKGSKMSFIEEQIVTTRNITGNPIIDFVYLGLNYQIEHHLFPSCPRSKLKLITPYVEKTCKEIGIEFHKVGIIKSNKIILGELARLSATI